MNARILTTAIIIGMLLLSAFGGTAVATDTAKSVASADTISVALR